MIILDTNVASALVNEREDQLITHWFDKIPLRTLWLNTVTWMELCFGCDLLPPSRRKTNLRNGIDYLRTRFTDRIISFDEAAAEAAAQVSAQRRLRGITIDFRDTQIAGIAISRAATLATRNARHFEDLNLDLIDPGLPGGRP